MAAKCKYLFDPKEYIFVPRSQMFSQILNQHFVNVTNLNAWLFLRCFLDNTCGDVHWEFETNIAIGTLDIGIAGVYLTQMKQTSVSLSCQN